MRCTHRSLADENENITLIIHKATKITWLRSVAKWVYEGLTSELDVFPSLGPSWVNALHCTAEMPARTQSSPKRGKEGASTPRAFSQSHLPDVTCERKTVGGRKAGRVALGGCLHRKFASPHTKIWHSVLPMLWVSLSSLPSTRDVTIPFLCRKEETAN